MVGGPGTWGFCSISNHHPHTYEPLRGRCTFATVKKSVRIPAGDKSPLIDSKIGFPAHSAACLQVCTLHLASSLELAAWPTDTTKGTEMFSCPSSQGHKPIIVPDVRGKDSQGVSGLRLAGRLLRLLQEWN